MNLPKLNFKIELTFPSEDGSPPKKFVVNRPLKARWHKDIDKCLQDIQNEIKNYRGSFMGDLLISLSNIVESEDSFLSQQDERCLQVTRWAASIVDTLIFSSIRERLHEEIIGNFELQEWDGSMLKLESISSDDLKKVDMDKLMLLLTPKIKHAISLIFKEIKKN